MLLDEVHFDVGLKSKIEVTAFSRNASVQNRPKIRTIEFTFEICSVRQSSSGPSAHPLSTYVLAMSKHYVTRLL